MGSNNSGLSEYKEQRTIPNNYNNRPCSGPKKIKEKTASVNKFMPQKKFVVEYNAAFCPCKC